MDHNQPEEDDLFISSGHLMSPIGSPLYQPEEDQQIVANNSSYLQNAQHIAPISTSDEMIANQLGSGIQIRGQTTPQSMTQPQTPSLISLMMPMTDRSENIHQMICSERPMTSMTPADTGVQIQFQNVVSTVNLSCKLDLKKIAIHARNAEYNPKRFPAVIMKIREPRTTALIFSSGKMVCTGAQTEEDSRLTARKYARIIQKLGFTVKFLDFKIQNMVGSCDVKFPIRLEGLVLTHGNFSTYEPETFPGLIYKMVKPRIVLLIFVSGKVVLTGGKSRQEIYDAFDNIYSILRQFKK